jgi:site-specific recombinase XerC
LTIGERLVALKGARLRSYLDDFAVGRLPNPVARTGRRRSPSAASLRQARTVLRQLYAHLQSLGMRLDNPLDGINLPQSVAPDRSAPQASRWISVRPKLLPAPSKGADDEASARGVAIAELSFWMGLRPSEVAAATMGDFRRAGGRWRLRISRFGTGQTDEIDVPDAVIVAIRRYRQVRGLKGDPKPREIELPLIASLFNHAPVKAWTIAHALATLAPTPDGRPLGLTARSLREELVRFGLSQQLPHECLIAHLRSSYTVAQSAEAPDPREVRRTLELLAHRL